MKHALLFALLSAGASSACFTYDGLQCTELFAFGLNVTVTDEAGAPVCDATVIAREGTYEETLELQPGSPCTYVGAGERAGTYALEAQKAGFTTATKEGVVVEADECHVIGETATLVLTPE